MVNVVGDVVVVDDVVDDGVHWVDVGVMQVGIPLGVVLDVEGSVLCPHSLRHRNWPYWPSLSKWWPGRMGNGGASVFNTCCCC